MDKKKELAGILIGVFIAVIMAGLLPVTAGYVLHAFENIENQAKFQMYIGILFVGVLLVTSTNVLEWLYPKKWWAIVHDPDKSIVGKYGVIKHAIKLIALSLIIFSIVGFVSAISNTFFSQTPQLFGVNQQISEVSTLFFGAEPAATSETWLFLGIICLVMSLLRIFIFKDNMDKKWVKVLVLLVLPFLIFGPLWMGYHSIVYGGNEINLLKTYTFGAFGSFLTLLTCSIIPWWAWHVTNNLAFQANLMFSDQRVILYGVILLIVILTVSLLILFKKNKSGS
jgi:hypothetical protein